MSYYLQHIKAKKSINIGIAIKCLLLCGIFVFGVDEKAKAGTADDPPPVISPPIAPPPPPPPPAPADLPPPPPQP